MMNTTKAVAKNTGAIILGDGVGLFFDFIIGVGLARYLGVAGYGVYSFVFGYLAFVRILITLGINKILVREISRDSAITAKAIGNMLIVRATLSVLAIFLSILIINLLNYSDETKILVAIASFSLVFMAAKLTITAPFNASLRMKYFVIGEIAGKIMLALLVVTIVFLKGTLVHVFISFLASSFTSFFITFIFYRKFFSLELKFDFPYSMKILRESILLTPAIFFGVIYYRTDIIMLSIMKTNVDVGYYSAAFKLIEILSVIPMAFMASLFPLFSKYFVESKNLFRESFEKSLRLMTLLGLPIAVSMTVFSEEIISIIFGRAFLPSAGALSILVWAEVFIFVNSVFVNLLISMNRQSVMISVAGCMALLNVTLNYILIPNYSYYGSGVATVFTMALGTIIYSYVIRTIIKESLNIPVLKIISVNILFYLFLRVFDFVPLYFIIPVSIIVYYCLLTLSGCISKEERATLSNIAKSVLPKRGI